MPPPPTEGASKEGKRSSSTSNTAMIFIVYLSLFLDNMLLTVVVPIIPDYLYNLEHNGTSGPGCSTCVPSTNVTSASGRTSSKPWLNQTSCPCGSKMVADNATSASNYIPEDIINENAKVGLLFSSKALVQLIANSFMGMIINRFGYALPLFFGNFSVMVSSTVFAYSSSYALLFLARSLQGIGSACIAVSGLGMIADRYPDDETRSKVMGLAMGGIAMGVLVGYPFGGVLYDFVGKTAPFFIIACFSLLNGIFQFCILELKIGAKKYLVGTPPRNILRDPYVLVIAGTIWVSTSAMAVLEPCLPIWLMDTISPEKWQLGTVFIPDSIGYLIGTSFFGIVAFKIGRWLVAFLSLLVVGFSAITVTAATQMTHLIAPHFLLGFGIGVIDSALMPLLAYIFDTRYTAEYGSVYAIAQAAVSLAYFVGPLIGSQVVKQIGFPWLMRTIGILNLVYSPACFYLRRISMPEEAQAIILDASHAPNYNTDYPQLNLGGTTIKKYRRFSNDGADSD